MDTNKNTPKWFLPSQRWLGRICVNCHKDEGQHAHVGDFCPENDWYSDKNRFLSQEDSVFMRECGILV
jgi:hypothetical protein